MSGVPSLDPVSTTTTSSTTGRALAIHSRRNAASFRATMQSEIVMRVRWIGYRVARRESPRIQERIAFNDTVWNDEDAVGRDPALNVALPDLAARNPDLVHQVAS
jgi:hypothetical protein